LLRLSLLFSMLVLAGCASKPVAPTAATPAPAAAQSAAAGSGGAGQKVAAADGSFVGEVVGTVKPGSKFSKIKIGMTMYEVNKLIKAPDDMSRHETGKRWIPFYFGNDAQRLETFYEGEGCLTYTGGNVFGGGDNRLIRITVSATRQCME
jgi:hypothetical protein